MRRRAMSDNAMIPVSWAIVCDFRRGVDGQRFQEFPSGGLTREESRFLEEAIGYLDLAAEKIRKAQGSLSKRSKDAGYEDPDYKTARKMTL